MPPIEETQNTAPTMPAGSETPPEDTPQPAPVSDTADVASPSTTDSPTDAPAVLEPVPEVPVPVETVPSPIVATPEPVVAPTTEPTPSPVVVKRNDVREYLAMALEKITGKKVKKLAKIMGQLEKRGSITNDEVEKLIHCSDASATRYLSQLEKEGKLVQAGKTGRSVKYTKV